MSKFSWAMDYDVEQLIRDGEPLMRFRLPSGEIKIIPANHWDHPDNKIMRRRKMRAYVSAIDGETTICTYNQFQASERRKRRKKAEEDDKNDK